MKSFVLALLLPITWAKHSSSPSSPAQCERNGGVFVEICYSSSNCTMECVSGSGSRTGNLSITATLPVRTTLARVTKREPVPTNQPATKGVKYAGINIAGFDFGSGTDGSGNIAGAQAPLTQYGGADGAGQMSHFVKDDKLNIFRLPVGWQYLVNGVLGGNLDATNSGKYDALVQACLKTGATCLIDIHNYARWNGAIIGQGGPSNEQFASVWSQLATKYAKSPKVAFGLMNEPHDIPDITKWAASVQAAVTAIRKAGATTQMILLPGNNYTSAQAFVTNGSGAALQKVTNPDNSTTNLIFDVHKYLDSTGAGKDPECTSDQISNSFAPLATWLRAQKRQAMLTETGGGNTASCICDVCAAVKFLNSNADVYLGYVGWAAGGFKTTYALSETPTDQGGKWTDQSLVKSCIAR